MDAQRHVAKLVNNILLLRANVTQLKDKKAAEGDKLKREIRHTDRAIEDVIFKLYGITDEEKKIIEESLQ